MSNIAHHTPTREISMQVDVDSLIKRWSEILFGSNSPQIIRRLTNKEVGLAIKNARLVACRSRKEIAAILKIDVETLPVKFAIIIRRYAG